MYTCIEFFGCYKYIYFAFYSIIDGITFFAIVYLHGKGKNGRRGTEGITRKVWKERFHTVLPSARTDAGDTLSLRFLYIYTTLFDRGSAYFWY